MLIPPLESGIEESDNFAAFRIYGRKVRPFASVAVPASKREVIGRRFAAVLFRDNVVRLMRLKHIILVDPAEFAATTGTRPHSVPQSHRDSGDAHDLTCAASIRRAWAFRSVMRWLR